LIPPGRDLTGNVVVTAWGGAAIPPLVSLGVPSLLLSSAAALVFSAAFFVLPNQCIDRTYDKKSAPIKKGQNVAFN